MYNELYELWKRELQNIDLGKLPPDFYSRIASYLREIRKESRMLDRRAIKASLLKSEARNVRRMLRELVRARYKKLVKRAAGGEKVPSDFLTVEEEKLLTGISPLAEAYQNFAKGLVRGQVLQVDVEPKRKDAVLRFLADVPAIIGVDMKTHGPFKLEDIASLPIDNAKILVKEGLAEKVEVN